MKLSGKKVKVTLRGSVGLGRIDNGKLYGPGEEEVPVELADALGLSWTEDQSEDQTSPSGSSNSTEGTGSTNTVITGTGVGPGADPDVEGGPNPPQAAVQPTPAPDDTGGSDDTGGEGFPEDFPDSDALTEAGYESVEDVEGATDEELNEAGISKAAIKRIRKHTEG